MFAEDKVFFDVFNVFVPVKFAKNDKHQKNKMLQLCRKWLC